MHGNVWEYVEASPYAYASTPGDAAVLSETDPLRGSRGGSYGTRAIHTRSAVRRWFSVDNNPGDTGLRPVAEIRR